MPIPSKVRHRGSSLAQDFQCSFESLHACGRFCQSLLWVNKLGNLRIRCLQRLLQRCSGTRLLLHQSMQGCFEATNLRLLLGLLRAFCGAQGTATGFSSPLPLPLGVRGHWTEGGRGPRMTSYQPLRVATVLPSPARHELRAAYEDNKRKNLTTNKSTPDPPR